MSENPNAMLIATLEAVIKQYTDGVAASGGGRASSVALASEKRNALANNVTHRATANTILEQFRDIINKVCDENPELLPAMYEAVNKRLVTSIKEDRDSYIDSIVGVRTPVEGAPSAEELKKHKEAANSLFQACRAMNVDLSHLPTKTTKVSGKVTLALPGLPKTRDLIAQKALTRKMLWTVDGEQYPGYSLRAIRKIIGVDTVAEVNEVMGWEGKNMHTTTVTYGDKEISFAFAGVLSVADLSELEDDDDDEDTTD